MSALQAWVDQMEYEQEQQDYEELRDVLAEEGSQWLQENTRTAYLRLAPGQGHEAVVMVEVGSVPHHCHSADQQVTEQANLDTILDELAARGLEGELLQVNSWSGVPLYRDNDQGQGYSHAAAVVLPLLAALRENTVLDDDRYGELRAEAEREYVDEAISRTLWALEEEPAKQITDEFYRRMYEGHSDVLHGELEDVLIHAEEELEAIADELGIPLD